MPKEIPLDQVDSQSLYSRTPRKKKALEDDSVCEVKFCTSGRLSAPPILHFYDYNMVSAQLISELPSADNYMPLMIKILNSMVVEDFDCGQLHIEEIKEVLLNIHAKWWGPMLQGFPYFLNTELEGDALLAKENVSYADIPIANLIIDPLPPEIKEPINISHGGTVVQFVYPRSENSAIADEEMKKRFAEHEQSYFQTKQLIKAKRIDEVPLAVQEAYNAYLAQRAEWKLLLLRAQYIRGVNGAVLDTLDSRIEALQNDKRIGMRHFELYNKFLEEKGKFGLQDEVEFYSDVLDRKVKRPFRFRTYSFIPSLDSKRDDANQISFG